jgi:toxin-antitoxin system PIN domain toxin
MRSLLDVNLLIALLDADHALHHTAMSWFARHAAEGWVSCPITQNGCVRIMSHPGYPNALPVRRIIERLQLATVDPIHQFWPDDISLLDSRLIDSTRIHGPRQLTDIYLLALAVRHGGRLVTLDSAITLDAVIGAKPKHLLKL